MIDTTLLQRNYRIYSMTTKHYDAVVFIGRFQPLHYAHVEMLQRASLLSKKLIVIVGSANQPRTFKNPWSFEERASLIATALDSIGGGSDFEYVIEKNHDTIYNNQSWAVRVQGIVNSHTSASDKIALIGHKKDETSFYLDMFPQWDTIDQHLIEQLNASDIRDLYFKQDANLRYLRNVVPESTFNFMEKFAFTEAYEDIIKEREFVASYKRQFAGLPYSPIFVTTDAVVVQSGHVLMIKRRAYPGKGLWALPGGFVNADTDRSIQDAAIRELREETGIKIPVPVLNGSIVNRQVFDAIGRSTRGRTITHAFHIQLPDHGPLPKVKGLDDAEKAVWLPISTLDPCKCYEDHYEIISHFVGT